MNTYLMFFQLMDTERSVINLLSVNMFNKGFSQELPEIEMYVGPNNYYVFLYESESMRDFDYTALVNALTNMPNMEGL